MLLEVAYDGTGYAGWQRQPAQPSICAAIESVLAKIEGSPVRLRGASRTDAGVHALQQYAAFDTARQQMPPQGWYHLLNQQLPETLRIRRIHEVAVGFEPRFHCAHKTYRYQIALGSFVAPHWCGQVWALHRGRFARQAVRNFDLEALRRALSYLEGEHDFAAFRAADDARTETRRHILQTSVEHHLRDAMEVLSLRVCGTGFLKQMVRIIVGSVVEVATGIRSPESLRQALEPGGERRTLGPTAPPQGLCLEAFSLQPAAVACLHHSYPALRDAPSAG